MAGGEPRRKKKSSCANCAAASTRCRSGLPTPKNRKSEAVDALKESERAISDANRALRDLAEQASEADARLARAARANPSSGQAALKQQQALLARLLYHHYVGGQTEPLKLLLNREDPNQIARQLHYFSLRLPRARRRDLGAARRASRA